MGQLRLAGFELLATFSRPHYSVLMPGLEAAGALVDALGELRLNPYAGGQETGGPA